MKLEIHTALAYDFAQPSDILLQIEAAAIPEQTIRRAWIDISPIEHFARVPAQDAIGDRIWLHHQGLLEVDYKATVAVERRVQDVAGLAALPPHKLPGEAVQYLMDSRYCPADQFQTFVEDEFGRYAGGARIAAMRDWIAGEFRYTPGSSDSRTTALDSFVARRGVCRDYAHVLITLARASAIPARIASVYAPDVDPPDFHAVAEIFLASATGPGGEWHLVDATGMATEADMAKIGIGRDAADVGFLTSYGNADFRSQTVSVRRA